MPLAHTKQYGRTLLVESGIVLLGLVKCLAIISQSTQGPSSVQPPGLRERVGAFTTSERRAWWWTGPAPSGMLPL